MRSRRIVLALLALLIISGAGFLFARPEPLPPVAPSIVFTGTEPGRIFNDEGLYSRAAGIRVTNHSGRKLVVSGIEVQVFSNNLWHAVSSGPPEVSGVLEPGESITNKYSTILASGDYQKFVVPWPVQRPCRVRVHYRWELTGRRALMSKIHNAWLLRDPSRLRSGRSAFGGLHEIVSEEISR